ncbi:biotin--[acetyl-CoA-carboxylase] ligase [Draconibacterium sp. IB214405]|uniref:biotin--[acetyl-CoA-carboxylase] ligase n=1 Tax=Draconibacterium sp. IB214405 TaxID=3097352 RepID=UPI002A16D0CA|nr:biotin--[acetyl-CoA-carboxylase] ligase [Draconibacterium sp. IB214405]MDX8338362.1 biotin--[acetyl-CoA-carboxylase] ligase [Draconibacterium sp. IB214405]
MFLTDKNIILLSEVDSTNNYAKQLVAEKAASGTVVLAQYQQNGRGQVGNFWESEAGKNLLFSLILYPVFLEAGKQFYISKVVSLALVEVLSEYLDDVKIKWPNDIYVGVKKIAGILIENTMKGNSLDSSVIGVGMNINQEKFVSDAPNPVSMKQLLGKEISKETILKSFLVKLDELIGFLIEGNLSAVDRAYLSTLFRGEGWHTYRTKGKEFSARIAGIGSFGQLRLQESGGNITEYMFKEVEFVV